MKNRLSDLNNHLFAQLERLGEEGLSSEKLKQETDRAKAMAVVAEKIVHAATLELDAVRLVAKHGTKLAPMMPKTISAGAHIEHRAQPVKPKTPEDLEREAADLRRSLREQGLPG